MHSSQRLERTVILHSSQRLERTVLLHLSQRLKRAAVLEVEIEHEVMYLHLYFVDDVLVIGVGFACVEF